MSRLRTAAKFFTVGLLVGLLFAPRSGEETRHKLREHLPGSNADA